MAIDQQRLEVILFRKFGEWNQYPLGGAVQYIRTSGVDGLTAELAQDPDLSLLHICGIFKNPEDDFVFDLVKSILGISDPFLGDVASTLTQALLKACEQKRYITHKQAKTAALIGTGVTLGTLILVSALSDE